LTGKAATTAAWDGIVPATRASLLTWGSGYGPR
jgi:hypothetical protein